MTTLVVLGLFTLMIAAPCLVAAVSAKENKDEVYEVKTSKPAPARNAVLEGHTPARQTPPARHTPPARQTPPPPGRVPVARSPLPQPLASRPMTLPERAAKAESDAIIAQELARQAHWAALAAAAQAAALRADAAEQFARMASAEAQDAILAVEREFGVDYRPETQPLYDSPHARVNRRQAA